MKLSKNQKFALAAIGAAALYKLYSLYEIGEKVSYTFKGIKFKLQGGKYFVSVPTEVLNPTSGTLMVKDIVGELYLQGQLISTFQSGPFKLNKGITNITINFEIKSLEVVSAITKQIAARKLPKFEVVQKTRLPLFTISDKYTIDTALYANDLLGGASIF